MTESPFPPVPTAEKPADPERDHWLVRPSTIRRLWIAFYAVLAVTVLADFFLEHHPHFGIDGTIGFAAWFGFGACFVMVVFSKGLGFLLKREDTYYRDGAEGGGTGEQGP